MDARFAPRSVGSIIESACARPGIASPALVPDRLAAIARAAPDAIALEAGAETLTYEGLDSKAAELARRLRSLGVRAEVPVAICLPRSLDQVIALLAVLKAGGAFVPLDPAWPDDRLRFVVKDAGIGVILTTSEDAARFQPYGGTLVTPGEQVVPDDLEAPLPTIDRSDLAYVMYTSGSTGTPKGVEIDHDNFAHFTAGWQRFLTVSAEDSTAYFGGLAFDGAISDLWPFLTVGAKIVLPDESLRTSPPALQSWLIDQKLSVILLPTVLVEALLALPWPADCRLRTLIAAGEALTACPSPGLPFALVNGYGPAECSVAATAAIVPAGKIAGAPPIGRPLAHVRIHLLDPEGKPVPAGTPGEIWIGGAGVGRGYRGRPDLTAERFRPDPFADEPGARLYRTGDMARELPDGQFAFEGRIDLQEKIRGHRVELNEVAQALSAHPAIVSCAVVARGDRAADKTLVAYVVTVPLAKPTAEALRAALARTLPDYMIPAEFVAIAALPLTPNGKVDKAALPHPSPENTLERQAYRAPSSVTERRVAMILETVLGRDRVGADDDFFLIGGNSLSGAVVVGRVRDAFGIGLTLEHLFKARTAAGLARSVESLVLAKLGAMSDAEVADQARERGLTL